VGDFPAFSRSSKHSICCRFHFLLVEEGKAFGVNFGASKLEQTLSRFFWVFDKDLRNNLAEFSRQM